MERYPSVTRDRREARVLPDRDRKERPRLPSPFPQISHSSPNI